MKALKRTAVKFIRTLTRGFNHGTRDWNVASLVTPKWARAGMRKENRFKRAMGRTQLPILKRWRLEQYVKLNGHLPTLKEVVSHLENSTSYLRWMQTFYKRGKESFLARSLLRRRIKKNRVHIRNTIEH